MTAWLKALGTSADPLPDDWSRPVPYLLRQASFGHMPGSVEVGDLLVYYATGLRRVFAIAEVVSPPTTVARSAASGATSAMSASSRCIPSCAMLHPLMRLAWRGP